MTDECKPLSDKEYWDRQYSGSCCLDLQLEGYVNRPNQLILGKILPLVNPAGNVLEIGAGGSLWLPYFAAGFPDKHFVGLDYSENGCRTLKDSADRKGLKVDVVNADVFDPPEYLLGKMDLVFSLGVVEHFADLHAATAAIQRFMSKDGIVFTLIPNMRGVLGDITRLFDSSVYDIHVPHNLKSLVGGHEDAGLKVLEAGYLCSSNFGVLSSAVKNSRWKFEFYKLLSRLSKVGWLFEEKFFPLPATPYISPYIFCIAKSEANGSVRRDFALRC